MKGNRYRRVTHHCAEWIIRESPWHHFRNGTKHWAKKYLARRERFRAKRTKGEENDQP